MNGGWDTAGVPVAATVAYDPASDSWETVAPNPTPRAAPGTAVVDDQLYLVGGCVGRLLYAVEHRRPLRPGERQLGHAGSLSAHHLVDLVRRDRRQGVLRRRHRSGTSATDGFVYDPAADSWSPIANMPFNLWGSAYGAANGMLVISSGLTNQQLTNQGVAYDPSSDSWSALPNAQFPRHRAGGGVRLLQGRRLGRSGLRRRRA